MFAAGSSRTIPSNWQVDVSHALRTADDRSALAVVIDAGLTLSALIAGLLGTVLLLDAREGYGAGMIFLCFALRVLQSLPPIA